MAAAATGTLDAGTLAGPVALDAALAAAGAVTAGVVGKNVACLPLCSCHLSHSRTMEKPKITHRMVRRMSFMKTSLVSWMGWWKGKTARKAACCAAIVAGPGHGPRHTRGGSVPACAP
ncbi:hypothetical protein D3C72_1767760 [compost metagenome]